MMAAAFGIYICYRLMTPFLPSITAAISLAVVFVPLQRMMESRLKRPGLAAMLSVLVIALPVVALVTLIMQQVVAEAASGAQYLEMKVTSGEWLREFQSHPWLAALSHAIERQVDISGTAQTLAQWLNVTAGSFVKGSVFQLIGVFLTFYLLSSFFVIVKLRFACCAFFCHSRMMKWITCSARRRYYRRDRLRHAGGLCGTGTAGRADVLVARARGTVAVGCGNGLIRH